MCWNLPFLLSFVAKNRRAHNERGDFGLIVSIRHPHNANDGNEDSLLRPSRAGEPEALAITPDTRIDEKKSGTG